MNTTGLISTAIALAAVGVYLYLLRRAEKAGNRYRHAALDYYGDVVLVVLVAVFNAVSVLNWHLNPDSGPDRLDILYVGVLVPLFLFGMRGSISRSRPKWKREKGIHDGTLVRTTDEFPDGTSIERIETRASHDARVRRDAEREARYAAIQTQVAASRTRLQKTADDDTY